MIGIDTNVLVRFITRDDERQERKARSLFLRSVVRVTATVLLETEWVLRSIYRFDRIRVADALTVIVDNDRVVVDDPDRMRAAIEGYRAGLDFADALHLASSNDVDEFATFDRALIKAAPAAFDHPPVISP
jgi:predicted nucleic-acid-binding protein